MKKALILTGLSLAMLFSVEGVKAAAQCPEHFTVSNGSEEVAVTKAKVSGQVIEGDTLNCMYKGEGDMLITFSKPAED